MTITYFIQFKVLSPEGLYAYSGLGSNFGYYHFKTISHLTTIDRRYKIARIIS